VFENKTSKQVFGPERGAVTGNWRNLHHEISIICALLLVLLK
jgi:hypothetical protein